MRETAGVFVKAYREFSRDNVMRLSAALSYYALFSLAPLLLIAIGIAGGIFGQKAAQGQIAVELQQFTGSQTAEAVQSILQSASKHSSGATLVGFVTLLAGASTLFAQLKASLNVIWKVEPRADLGWINYIRAEVFTFGMVLAIGFLLLISLVLSTTVAAFIGWLDRHWAVPAAASASVGFLLPMLIEVLLFALLFKVLPDARVQWRSAVVGGLLTSALFGVGKVALSFYLARSGSASSFGAAGSAVVLLVWIYYASCIVFYGAEFTQVYARESGEPATPARYATTTEIWTEKGPTPVKCAEFSSELAHLVSGVGAKDGREPAKETLAVLRRTSVRTGPQKSAGRPLVELGAAVGAGLLVGALWRWVDRTKS